MNVLIIEDEPLSANRLKKMVLEYDPGIKVLDILDSVEQSVKWFRTHKEPDLVFLDIQLSDGESFSIFKEVNLESPVIFTTAYNEFAIKAFSLNSIDYLLKPVKKDELVEALKKYEKFHRHLLPDYGKLRDLAGGAIKNHLNRMMVKIGAAIRSFEVAQVAYFCIIDGITYAVIKDGNRYPVDQSLEKLEKELDPERFFRINRQYIISYDAIEKMVAYSKSRIKIKLMPPTETDAISSSEKTPLFRKWLEGNSES